MKGFLFFLTVLVACHAYVANDTELLTLLRAQAQDKDCGSDGLQCKNSNEIQYCSQGAPLFDMKCADQNPSKPYCDLDDNMCTSKVPGGPTGPDKFLCPSAGYYPDLLDCSKNHYCDGNNPNPVGSEVCPKGSIYDQKLEFCNPYALCRTYSSDSGLCRGNIDKFLSYASSPYLFVFCKADNPILFACPSKDLQFDVSSVGCIFKCKANGRFPYHGDTTKYYHCVYISTSYVQQILQCPKGSTFDQNAINGNGKCS